MSDALITTLKTLKLFGMADTIAHLDEQASPVYQQASCRMYREIAPGTSRVFNRPA